MMLFLSLLHCILETQIECPEEFVGHLFINKDACRKLVKNSHYSADDTISTCQCFCGSDHIYCKAILKNIISTTEQPSTPIQTATRITFEGTQTSEATRYTFDTSSQDSISSSVTTIVTKNHALKINENSGETIGAAVGGTAALLLFLLLPLMFLIWRRKVSRKTRGKPKDLPIQQDGFINNAYNGLEENTGSMHVYLNENDKTADQHYDMPGNKSLHDKEYDYVRVQEISSSTSVNQLPLDGRTDNSGNYELAHPIPQDSGDNYFIVEPQVQENSGNYFVLEKEHNTNKASDECVADNVYNTLNEKHKTVASTDDEYHHLREISRPMGKGTTNGDTSDYDVLAKGSNYKDEDVDDDYDHCKPKL